MPSFCRHNRLIQNCPICAREQDVELRPVITSSAPKVAAPRPAGGAGHGATDGSGSAGRLGSAAGSPAAGGGRGGRTTGGGRGAGGGGTGVRVRRLARGVEDGYHEAVVPGLKSSADAARLADEIAFAARRLEQLELDPPGLLAEVAAPGDVEERTWLAFQIAYVCPLDDPDPFAAIAATQTSWASGELPDLSDARTGPRTAHDRVRGTATLAAYRSWAERAGSQAAAFGGEASWTPERRFARAFERLSLPGLHRDARYELLVLLGRLSVYELRGGTLQFGGENEATVGAKRALGIGDPLLLERRAAALAEACAVPLEALDLALHNWSAGTRVGLGLPPGVEPGADAVARARRALGL